MVPHEKTLKGIKTKIIHKYGCHVWSGTLVNKAIPYYNGKNVQKFIWAISKPPVNTIINFRKKTYNKVSSEVSLI